MKGSAWPLLVGGVICLLNCVNERDLCQLLDVGVDLGIPGAAPLGVLATQGAETLVCLLIGIT